MPVSQLLSTCTAALVGMKFEMRHRGKWQILRKIEKVRGGRDMYGKMEVEKVWKKIP
jgi:hypothetical protein